jgi:predicted lipoprotein with Yx(FWY)xxD motif
MLCMQLRRILLTAAAVAVLAVSSAAAAVTARHKHASASGDWTVSLRETAYGKILVNSQGDTLYLWAVDKPDESECEFITATPSDPLSNCLAVWPFVLVSNAPTAGPGVNARLLGTIDVPQGDEVTYNAHPLYTYISDTKPGETTGEGSPSFGSPWWVVSAAGNAITRKSKATTEKKKKNNQALIGAGLPLDLPCLALLGTASG